MEENKKVEDVISDREKQMAQGLAMLMDAIWGNSNGSKGMEEFLKQDSSVLKNPNHEEKQ